MQPFRRFVTTPHVLAETGNFIDQAPQYRRADLLETYRGFIATQDEVYEDARSLANRDEFAALGLADTGLSSLSTRFTVITMDFQLTGKIRGGRGGFGGWRACGFVGGLGLGGGVGLGGWVMVGCGMGVCGWGMLGVRPWGGGGVGLVWVCLLGCGLLVCDLLWGMFAGVDVGGWLGGGWRGLVVCGLCGCWAAFRLRPWGLCRGGGGRYGGLGGVGGLMLASLLWGVVGPDDIFGASMPL